MGEGPHRSSPLAVAVDSLQGLLVAVLVGVSMYASMTAEEEMRELLLGTPFDFAFLLGVGTALLTAAIGVVAAVVMWRTRTWELAPSELVLRSGVLVRNERRIPYQRVHSVDLSASVVERILGLVSLKVDTGADAGNVVKSLRRGEAEVLKRAIFARKASVAKQEAARLGLDALAAEKPGAVRADELQSDVDYEFNLPNDQHVRASLTDFGVGSALASAVVVFAGVFQYGEALFGAYLYDMAARMFGDVLDAVLGSEFNVLQLLLPAFLSTLVSVLVVLLAGWVISVIAAYVRWGGFVLRRRGRRIEVSCGLLSRSTRAVDLGRVQSVSIDASPIRRALGLVQVAVRTVGSVGGQGNGNDAAARERVVVHPCMPRAEAAAFVAQVLPEFADVTAAPVEELELDALPRVALRRTLVRGGIWTLLFVACAVLATLVVVPQGGERAFITVLSFGVACLWAAVLLGCAAMFAVRVLAWRIRRIGTAGSMLVVVDGGLGRRVTYVSRPKAQSMTRRVSPFQKRAGVATVAARTACISAEPDPKMRDVDGVTAVKLMEWVRPHYDNAEEAQRALAEAGLA